MIDESQLDIDIDMHESETLAMPATHHNMPTHHHVIAPSLAPQMPQQTQTEHAPVHIEHTAHQDKADVPRHTSRLEYVVMSLAILAFILLCVEQVLMFTSLLGHVR